jgi:hypothetical protein
MEDVPQEEGTMRNKWRRSSFGKADPHTLEIPKKKKKNITFIYVFILSIKMPFLILNLL